MITPHGYSKDPSIKPEGIVLTLPVAFFEDRRTSIEDFKKMFVRLMAREDALWHFRLTNLPKHEVAWVYLIFDRQIQFRLNFVQYERNVSKSFKDAPDGLLRDFPNANWVVMCGPAIAPPREWFQRGHQGAKYATKLF